MGSELQVEFVSNLNINGTGCDCSRFVATFALQPLTQAQLNNLNATYPATFPLGVQAPADCCFGLFSGLPCGATFMLAQVLDGGADGYAILDLTIGWANGTFVSLQFTHTISDDTANCVANFSWADEGVAGTNVGYSSGGAPPCDFLQLYFSANWNQVIITMES